MQLQYVQGDINLAVYLNLVNEMPFKTAQIARSITIAFGLKQQVM